MQNFTKFAFALAILAAMAVGSMAIDCYVCSGPVGESGGCGQDPFHVHFVTTPDVSTAPGATVCFVSVQIRQLKI